MIILSYFNKFSNFKQYKNIKFKVFETMNIIGMNIFIKVMIY